MKKVELKLGLKVLFYWREYGLIYGIEKPNLSADKEKLKHLRGELHNHEQELTRY